MLDNEIIPINEGPETAKEKFERERLTRRQALKKFGMTSAMAAFALFSVDDLARMVGKTMQQRAGDNKVAEQIAQEFQQAGVVMADGTSGCIPSSASCLNCVNAYDNAAGAAISDYNNCMGLYNNSAYCKQTTNECQRLNDAQANWDHCNCHCIGMGVSVLVLRY